MIVLAVIGGMALAFVVGFMVGRVIRIDSEHLDITPAIRRSRR